MEPDLQRPDLGVARLLFEPANRMRFWGLLDSSSRKSLRLACSDFNSASRLLMDRSTLKTTAQLATAAEWINLCDLTLREEHGSEMRLPPGGLSRLTALTWAASPSLTSLSRCSPPACHSFRLRTLLDRSCSTLTHLSLGSLTLHGGCGAGLLTPCSALLSLHLDQVELHTSLDALVGDTTHGAPGCLRYQYSLPQGVHQMSAIWMFTDCELSLRLDCSHGPLGSHHPWPLPDRA